MSDQGWCVGCGEQAQLPARAWSCCSVHLAHPASSCPISSSERGFSDNFPAQCWGLGHGLRRGGGSGSSCPTAVMGDVMWAQELLWWFFGHYNLSFLAKQKPRAFSGGFARGAAKGRASTGAHPSWQHPLTSWKILLHWSILGCRTPGLRSWSLGTKISFCHCPCLSFPS